MEKKLLKQLSFEFAVLIIDLVKRLQENKEFIISNQIGRSGTSIGANINEAEYAQSKADFISKLKIALKEANETEYWLKLLRETFSLADEYYENLLNKCIAIKIKLIKSCKTASNKKE